MDLLSLDHELFFLINQSGSNALFDAVLPLLRNKIFWIPLYTFFFSFFVFNTSNRGIFWKILLAIGLTVLLADTASSKIMKPWVNRDRPCQSILLKEDVRLLVHCGGGKSFTSSHATNHFAVATVLFFLYGRRWRLRWLLYAWAFMISFSQIYVGVHFPMDVVAGALLGTLIARIVISLPFFEPIQGSFS